MQVLELHFNPKGRENKIYDSFCYEPENVYEKRLGSLYIIGQLAHAGLRHPQLLDNLSSAIKTGYYTLSAGSPAVSLRRSLRAANKFLADLVQKGKVDWLGNLDLAVLAFRQNEAGRKISFNFNFTKLGKIKILLVRQGQILEIGKNLEAQDINPYPLKVFFNTASGKLEENDRLIVVTRDLCAKFEDLIQRIGYSQTLDEKKLKELFKQVKLDPRALSGICFLTLLSRESATPLSLTFQEEPQKFVFLKKTYKVIRTSLAKIPLPSLSLSKILQWSRALSLKRKLASFKEKCFGYFQLLLRKPKLAKIKLPDLGKDLLNKKLALIPVLCFFLLLGFLIFKTEKTKSLAESQEVLDKIEAKIFQAENFLILQEKEKANLLLQQAWKEILSQTSAGTPLQNKASQIKEAIEQKLWQLNKLEKIENLEVLPDISPYLSVFGSLPNSFSLYLLDANTGRIIKYPYSLSAGRGQPQFWLKPKSEQTEKAPDMSGAKSITVDGSVWVLGKDNLVHRFYLGLYQETLNINIWPALENPIRIWTSSQNEELYLFEPQQKRVVVLDKSGRLLKQYQTD